MRVYQPRGIVSLLQTPFSKSAEVDSTSLTNLVEDAIEGGVDGFLVPAVASEVAELTAEERESILRLVASANRGRVALIAGASSDTPETSARLAALAEDLGAAAYLVAVPPKLYGKGEDILEFFRRVCDGSSLPLVIQDLEFHGPGLPLKTLLRLKDTLPTLCGLKIETLPAGPKYTAVRQCLGADFFIAGGWAVPQMIEALDRGIDAMIPESSMVRVYVAIDRAHRGGDRESALELFRQLLPVLTYANQEILTSIAFFKRLLVRKGIFRTPRMRVRGFEWDAYNRRIADELIDHYLGLEGGGVSNHFKLNA